MRELMRPFTPATKLCPCRRIFHGFEDCFGISPVLHGTHSHLPFQERIFTDPGRPPPHFCKLFTTPTHAFNYPRANSSPAFDYCWYFCTTNSQSLSSRIMDSENAEVFYFLLKIRICWRICFEWSLTSLNCPIFPSLIRRRPFKEGAL